MGYAHRVKWNENKIKNGIYDVINAMGLQRMPSRKEIEMVTNNTALSNKISKTGGFYFWANKLNIPIKKSETNFGIKYEHIAVKEVYTHLKLNSKITSVKHPYDIIVENFIKIDIKASNRFYYDKENYYYTFQITKIPYTCDIFVFYCIDDNGYIDKTLIIPSCFLKVKQLSIGKTSKYDIYINKWKYIEDYYKFYKTLN